MEEFQSMLRPPNAFYLAVNHKRVIIPFNYKKKNAPIWFDTEKIDVLETMPKGRVIQLCKTLTPRTEFVVGRKVWKVKDE